MASCNTEVGLVQFHNMYCMQPYSKARFTGLEANRTLEKCVNTKQFL